MSEQDADAAPEAESTPQDGDGAETETADTTPEEDGETPHEAFEREDTSEADDSTEDAEGSESAAASAESADGEATAEETEDVNEELLERVTESEPEEIARELATLEDRIEELESRLQARDEELEDMESRLKRKQADFQNYKKRQKERMEEEKQRATEDLVTRLLDVRDNLRRALDQDDDADIRGGVESTLRQFDEEFERENVTPIEPDPGEDVDPKRHEALATIASDQPEDTIAEVHRPGYEMAGKVLRPAQVAVSDGSQRD